MSKLKPIEVSELLKNATTIDDVVQKCLTLEQPDIKTTHLFNGGMYVRTFYPMANSLIIGKIHKFAGFNILLKGSVTIFDGGNVQTFNAPHTWEAPANAQKIGLFHEDSEFTSVTTCFADNVEEAEKELYYPDETTIEQVQDWLDYQNLLTAMGWNEEDVQKYVLLDNLVKNSDLKDFELKKSKIHGIGYFATKDYKEGDLLGDALIDGKRTELGRWVNNSAVPNSISKLIGENDGKAYALRDIKSGEEITISYADNMQKRETL